MKKLKAALYTFYKSLASPHYYKDLLEVNFTFSIKYLSILAIIAFLITTPALLKPLKNDFNKNIDKFMENSTQYFPKDLEIIIKDGEININKEEPYIIPISEYDKGKEDYPRNLIVIDSKGTINDLDKHDTLILVNKSNILMKESNKIKVYPLENVPNTSITQKDFINTLEKVKPYIKILPYIIIPLVLIISGFIYFGSRVLYLFAVAFILWLFAKILGTSTKINLNYKKSYQIAIHSMTLPLLIETIADVANFPINTPLWFLIVNLIFGMTAIYYIAKNKTNKEY